VCGKNRVHLPLAGDTLQLVPTSVLEADAGASGQVAHRAGYQHLSWASQAGDSRRDRDRETANLAGDLFHLADMDAGADLDPELLHPSDDLGGAFDGCCGRVEHGEEAVAGSVDLATGVPPERGSDDLVMELDQVAPPSIAQLGSVLRRSHDVRHEDRRQESLARTRPAWHETHCATGRHHASMRISSPAASPAARLRRERERHIGV
jgi:hypothetical protein